MSPVSDNHLGRLPKHIKPKTPLVNLKAFVLAPGNQKATVKIVSCRPKGNLLVSVTRDDLFQDMYGTDAGDPRETWMLSVYERSDDKVEVLAPASSRGGGLPSFFIVSL